MVWHKLVYVNVNGCITRFYTCWTFKASADQPWHSNWSENHPNVTESRLNDSPSLYISVLLTVQMFYCDVTGVTCEGAACECNHCLKFVFCYTCRRRRRWGSNPHRCDCLSQQSSTQPIVPQEYSGMLVVRLRMINDIVKLVTLLWTVILRLIISICKCHLHRIMLHMVFRMKNESYTRCNFKAYTYIWSGITNLTTFIHLGLLTMMRHFKNSLCSWK